MHFVVLLIKSRTVAVDDCGCVGAAATTVSNTYSLKGIHTNTSTDDGTSEAICTVAWYIILNRFEPFSLLLESLRTCS